MVGVAVGEGGAVSLRAAVSCACCGNAAIVITVTIPASIPATPLTVEFLLRYYPQMSVPATTRILRTFEDRADAIAHFLRATHGLGAALSLLSRRAPELRHIRRWTQALFAEPAVGRSTQLLAGWFATSGAGFLFVPADSEEPFAYCEVAVEG